jgi:hypothetical protein
MAPLQKRAWWGLVVGIVFAAALFTVFFAGGGVSAFNDDAGFRLIIDILWVGGLVVNLIIMNITLRKAGQIDERDRMIMTWAPRVQWLAMIFSLAGWTIALTESYHETGLVPTAYLYLVFMTVLIVSTTAYCLGIIIGYRKVNHYG